MVLNAHAPAPAIVVPDEQTWTMSGVDPASLGVEPVFDPAGARRVLLPERVPDALAEPLAAYLELLLTDVDIPDPRLAFPGPVDLLRPPDAGEGEHDAHGVHSDHDGHGHDHDGHGSHGGHDHGDMMAIVGEPSADGLVMEPIEHRFGPLGTPLPGGLVADVTLDGDVVAACEVQALLTADGADEIPDRLAPRAWRLALARADEPATGEPGPPRERWIGLAAVEIERALSHAVWLRSFGRLLGWPALIGLCGAAVSSLLDVGDGVAAGLTEARSALDRIAAFVEGSRPLRWRTAGRAPVTLARARELGLHGPAVRASGLAHDARSDDPLYRHLGFEPVVREGGDALARTQVRAAEAVAAVDLAAAALEAAAADDAGHGLASTPAVVEGPRGPLRARRDGANRQLAAPGAVPALVAAGAAVVGAEWASALVGIASFDLSPWRLGA